MGPRKKWGREKLGRMKVIQNVKTYITNIRMGRENEAAKKMGPQKIGPQKC